MYIVWSFTSCLCTLWTSIVQLLTDSGIFTGPGSFFKPHQDTPRGENMFGSLVVVFPTAHEGGELALRPRDAEDTTVLDFGARLSEAKAHSSSIAYAVFFSDVTHEVYEVKRGQ